MKSLIGTSMLVITFILCIFFFDLFNRQAITYDDEQEGLSEQIVIKFSHVVAENTPKGLAAQKFAQLVEEKTEGLVKVEVIPNGTLYTDEEELDALKHNDVQMIAPSLSKMTKLSPEWGFFDLPFLFQENQDIETILSSEIGDSFLSLHEKEGIKGLALWSNGFKQMTSNVKSIQHPNDFMGQTFRIMPSSIIEAQFKLLGAQSLVVPFDQMYTALQAEQFEAQENTISNIYSRRIYGLQNYMTISNHGFLGYVVLINNDFWESLPEEVQPSIEAAMNETTSWMIAESQKMNEEQLQLIEQESPINIHVLSKEDQIEWYHELKPVYSQFLQSINDKDLEKFIKARMKQMETQYFGEP
jgi:tripartite ATP-independent transporter DctP family solute receptor